MRETQQYVVMHYGEVSIKGKNRPIFLRQFGRINVEIGFAENFSGRPAFVIAKTLVGKYKSAFGIFPVNVNRKIFYERLEEHL